MTLETISRAYTAELDVAGDGRTIVGRCVPYGAPARVADPGGDPYVEVWRRGAFRGAVKDPGHVHLVFAHDETAIGNRLGHAVSFDDGDEGLEGTFRTVGAPGDHALELVRSGMARGLSIHAAIVRSRVLSDGSVERQAARLLHVALVTEPAFPEARVTAIRASSSELEAEPALSIVELRAAQERLRVKYAAND